MITSFALVLLLGFELCYYLLIVQTGIVSHYNSDLITLFPMFIGGVLGTFTAGRVWWKIKNPIHKIMLALFLQLILSFLYPNYNFFTLALLGLSVGIMAPLGIYLFKSKQKKELMLALGIAYTLGTYFFYYNADNRVEMALFFTTIALISAFILRNYKVEIDTKELSLSFSNYLPLMFWIFLDSNLFETLSRHENINIWTNFTFTIIASHILGLMAACFVNISKFKKYLLINILFMGSYLLSYFELPIALAIVYPFVISYYNVVIFSILSKEMSLAKLSFIMIFVGWLASGFGLALALSKLLH